MDLAVGVLSRCGEDDVAISERSCVAEAEAHAVELAEPVAAQGFDLLDVDPQVAIHRIERAGEGEPRDRVVGFIVVAPVKQQELSSENGRSLDVQVADLVPKQVVGGSEVNLARVPVEASVRLQVPGEAPIPVRAGSRSDAEEDPVWLPPPGGRTVSASRSDFSFERSSGSAETSPLSARVSVPGSALVRSNSARWLDSSPIT